MEGTINQSLIFDITQSVRKNFTVSALSDLKGDPISYGLLAEKIARIHLIFREAGIMPGDKVSICARNSANWAVVFLSSLTYGTVTVPILNDFSPESIHHLVYHSDSRLFFFDSSIWKSIDIARLPKVEGFFDIDTSKLKKSRSPKIEDAYAKADELMGKHYPDGVNTDNFDDTYFNDKPDDLAVINYTSGSTGMSKGVMLSYGSLWSNERFATDNIPFFRPGDGMVSMLPLAHMFGLLVELIFPIISGCHITFLGRVPSPKILLDAFSEIRPKLVVTVPLVIEKIVINKVFPKISRQPVKALIKIPGIRNIIFSKIRRQMLDAFGGNLHQLVIGGGGTKPRSRAFPSAHKIPVYRGLRHDRVRAAHLLLQVGQAETRLMRADC